MPVFILLEVLGVVDTVVLFRFIMNNVAMARIDMINIIVIEIFLLVMS